MTRVGIWLSVALWAFSGVVCAEDVIYKCKSPAGGDVYSDKPCAAAKDMQQITLAPAPLPDITDLAPLCASEDAARLDLARLDRAKLDGLPAAQRKGVNDALAEYARGGSRPGARWGQGADKALHLCLPTFANEVVEYIATVDGKLVQMRGGMVSYLNDPETPQALLDRCADTWNQCISAPDSNADSCVAQIPTCAASEPWKGGRNCCPLQCKNTYHERRSAGVAGTSAFMSALYDAPSCVPGIAKALGR